MRLASIVGSVAIGCLVGCVGSEISSISDGSLNGTGDLQLNVSANTAPTLGYANASVVGGAGTPVNPATGPSDNGSVSTVAGQGTGTYTGTISVNAAGVVTLGTMIGMGISGFGWVNVMFTVCFIYVAQRIAREHRRKTV